MIVEYTNENISVIPYKKTKPKVHRAKTNLWIIVKTEYKLFCLFKRKSNEEKRKITFKRILIAKKNEIRLSNSKATKSKNFSNNKTERRKQDNNRGIKKQFKKRLRLYDESSC